MYRRREKTRIVSIESFRLSYRTMDAEASRPTLVAVAARAGVSPSTASLAFSGAGPVSKRTRARVLAAAEELGYAGPDPRAQSLRRGRSGIVGVFMEDRLSIAFQDPMNAAMLDGLSDELGPAGSGLLLLSDRSEGPASIQNAPIDAVVLIGCSTSLSDRVDIMKRRGVPVVGIEAEPLDGVVAIDLDNREASRTLAAHLRDLGHERVAMVTLPLDNDKARGALTAQREAAGTGYVAGQRILGVREVYPTASGEVAADTTVAEGIIAGRALLTSSPRPTAIVAQSDLLAVGVIQAATELGIEVPRDLSVVGFDGIALDGVHAAHDLTTMVQPAIAKGRAAGQAVLAMLAGEEPHSASLSSTFHRGATTARPQR
jgi:DNA-binding LacI/PurR family transcriptional regulator